MYAIKQNILPRGFFRPFRPRYQRVNLRPGKFKKVLNNSLNKKDYLFFFFCVWANSRLGEAICKCRRTKIAQIKNNPVYSSE